MSFLSNWGSRSSSQPESNNLNDFALKNDNNMEKEPQVTPLSPDSRDETFDGWETGYNDMDDVMDDTPPCRPAENIPPVNMPPIPQPEADQWYREPDLRKEDRNEDFNTDIDVENEYQPTPATEPQPTENAKEDTETETRDADATPMAEALESLFLKLESFQKIIDDQNQIIVSQNRRIEKYNEDIVMKLQKPVLLQIIEYVDRLQEILQTDDYMVDRDRTERLRELRNNVEILQKTIIADLENHRIYQYNDTQDNPLTFSQGRQQVKDREESSNENEFIHYGDDVKLFYRTTYPGYYMLSENKNGESVEQVLRREEVIKVVYRP